MRTASAWFLAWLAAATANIYLDTLSSRFGGDSLQGYLDWADGARSSYNASIFLPCSTNASEGMAVHWTLHDDDDTLRLAVAARATGWLALGLSEVGGMEGADVFTWETSRPRQITDAHILEERTLYTDDCQDWILVAAYSQGGFLIVETLRKLDTGDPQDRPIVRDDAMEIPGHRLIAAWGDSSSAKYHGNHRARGAIRWYRFGADEEAAFATAVATDSAGSFELLALNHTLQPVLTNYVHFCLSWSQMLDQGIPNGTTFTMIGIEPLIDPRTAANVHHFTLHVNRDTLDGVYCDDLTDSSVNALELLYLWAPGELAWALPDYLGASFGEGSYQSLVLEIHYNNPSLASGLVDNSGVRIYYSTTARKYEFGILQLGDPFVTLKRQTVGEGLSEHVFECPSTCTSLAIHNPVTVFQEHLHMHQVGAAARNELIRNGQVVHTGRIDYYNFDQQGGPAPVQEPFQVYPGDSFRTVCHYQTDGNRTFGLASSEEMCVAYLFYYPKLFFNVPWICARNLKVFSNICLAQYNSPNVSVLDRQFGPAATTCAALPPTLAPTQSPANVPASQPSTKAPSGSNGSPPTPDATNAQQQGGSSAPPRSSIGWYLFLFGLAMGRVGVL